jgi:Bifunctional DNA primase/polymerase, N-terminal
MPEPGAALPIAHAWADRGVLVLPIWPGGKAPLTRHGVHDASTDAEQLRRWWTRWPDANVAIATGAPGPDVLDVDVRGGESGRPALRRLRQAGIVPEGAPLAVTPSGGAHLYFLGTSQRNGSLPDLHLDFRSTGGYVLVPPSGVTTDAYSGTYRWERGGAPTAMLDWDAATRLLRPEPLKSRTRTTAPRPRRGWDVHTLADAVQRTPAGNRNNMLFWAMCTALRSGYDDLRPIAEAGLRCGQTAREVRATWRSAVRRVNADTDRERSSALPVPSRAPCPVIGAEHLL